MTDFTHHPDCRKCPLWEKVNSVGIGGEGMDNPVILFVGEAPGRIEDEGDPYHGIEPGHPFVGESGQLLRAFIQGNGHNVEGYITVPWRVTNILRCRPYVEKGGRRKDRKPTNAEMEACLPYLAEEIQHFMPKVVVALGETALVALLGEKYKGITRWRGNVIDCGEFLVIPTFHPSYVARNMNDPRSVVPQQFEQDMILINEVAINGKPEGASVNITTPRSLEELRRAIDLLESKDELAFDVETNSYSGTEVDSIWSPGFKLLSISFAYSERDSVAIPLFHKDSPFRDDPTLGGEYLRLINLLKTKKIIAHNGKFDIQAIFRQWGEWVKQDYDTMFAHYMLEEERGTHALEDLMKTYCPELAIWKIKKSTYDKQIKEHGYEAIPLDELLQYNAYDTLGTFKLKKILSAELLEHPKRQACFENVFMPVSEMLARVEAEGVVPDLKARDELKKILEEKLAVIKKLIDEWAKAFGLEKFNPGSTKQLSELLYSPAKMGLDVIGETKGGAPSTDDDTLLQLRTRVKKDERKFIDLIISHIDPEKGGKTDSYRGLVKLIGTYVDTLESYLGEDGKIHTSFMQTGTVTGRVSSKDPNLQNQPPIIRKLFKAPEGYKAVQFDYSQAELRLLSVLAGAETMKEVFRSGGDIHHETTLAIFGQLVVVTEELRRKGKETNFGIVYRESAKGLAEKLNISVKEAERYIDAIFQRYPELEHYFKEQVYLAKTYGFVETPFGNVRHTKGINFAPTTKEKARIIGEAERQAVNSPIQGGAGLICLDRMARLAKIIDWKDCRMVLNVHDAIYFYIRFNDNFNFWVETIKSVMEDTSTLPIFQFTLDIPFPVDVKVGDNFYEMNKIGGKTK